MYIRAAAFSIVVYYKYSVLLAFLALSCFTSRAQSNRSPISTADSLIDVLSKHVVYDTARVNMLNAIAKLSLSKDREQALGYASEADSLASELGYQRGEAYSRRLLGDYHKASKDYKQASVHYEQALNLWTLLGDPRERAQELIKLGLNHTKRRAFPVALNYLDSAVVLLEPLEEPSLLAEAYAGKGYIHYSRREHEGVQINYKKALSIREKNGAARNQIRPLQAIAISYAWQAQYDSCQQYYNRAFAISRQFLENARDTQRLASLLNGSAGVYKEQGYFAKAYEYLLQSLDLSERINHKTLMSANLNLLAFTHRQEENYDQAIELYERAEALALEADDSIRLRTIYNNMGCSYQAKCDYDQALEYYDRSLSIAQKSGNKYSIAKTYNFIGECHHFAQDPTQALFYLEKALKFSRDAQLTSEESKAAAGLARVYTAQGQFAEARRYAQRAYDLAVESNSGEYIKKNAELLVASNQGLGRYQEAFEYLSIAKTLGDSLLGEQKIRDLTTLEQQYKYDKEKELAAQEQHKLDLIRDEREKRLSSTRNFLIISLLLTTLVIGLVYRNNRTKKKANAILAKEKKQVEETSALLTKSVITRDKILGMLSHDVLGMIRFTSIIAKRLHASSDHTAPEEYQEYEGDLLESMDSLQGIIQKTLNWAKTQRRGFSVHKADVNIYDLAEEVLAALAPRLKSNQVKYHNTISREDTTPSDQQLLFSILHNLLENEIKHGQAKEIHLRGESSDQEYRLEISASGVIDASMLNTFFQSEDHSNYSHQGLGLFIVRDFITLLEARIEFIVHLKEKLHMIVIDLPYGDPVREPEQTVKENEN